MPIAWTAFGDLYCDDCNPSCGEPVYHIDPELMDVRCCKCGDSLVPGFTRIDSGIGTFNQWRELRGDSE